MAAVVAASDDIPSFRADREKFVKGNVAVFKTGVVLKDAPKAFSVDPKTLELHDVVGRGACSVVRRAIHLPSRTPLALKIFNINDREKRAQLVSEISALYNSDCECLVTFFGAFYGDDGTITVALEYMNGGSLSQVVKKMGPIPEHVLAGVVYQVLWALAYLKHDKRLHRDLKLSNILISMDGGVKLTDFGMSKELADSLALARSFKGTSTHMAPERIRHGSYSFAADVWSFGVCMLEGATGRNPYAGHGTYIATCDAILSQPAPSASGLPGASGVPLSAEFGQFISHCLRKEADERVPADILLASPWLVQHGVTGLAQAKRRVHTWIELVSTRGVAAANLEAHKAGAAAVAAHLAAAAAGVPVAATAAAAALSAEGTSGVGVSAAAASASSAADLPTPAAPAPAATLYATATDASSFHSNGSAHTVSTQGLR